MNTFTDALTPRNPSLIVTDLKDIKYLPRAEVFFELGLTLAIPDNLLRLLSRVGEGSEEHRVFLLRMLGLRGRIEGDQKRQGYEVVARLIDLLRSLRSRESLVAIGDSDVVPEIEQALATSFEQGFNYISLSPRRNFVREYFVKALSFARRQSAIIVTTSAGFFTRAGQYLSALQLRKDFNAIVAQKQEFVNRFWQKAGGPFVKYYVGIVVSAAGIVSTPFSVAGLVIAFVDP